MIVSEVIERPRGILTLRGVIPLPEATTEAAANASPDARTMVCPEQPAQVEPPTSPSRKVRRLLAAREVMATLRTNWPTVFAPTASEVKLLKVGIHRDIIAALPDIDVRTLGYALAGHVHRSAYQHALLEAGRERFDLEGNIAGEVTAKQVQGLMAERARLAEKSARRRAAEQRQARRR
jgi:hypothetical protein